MTVVANKFQFRIAGDIPDKEGFIRGMILKGVGGNYRVLLENGEEVTAKPRGIFRKNKITPYPGDFVDVVYNGDVLIPYAIEKILPRKSFLIRPAIANLDLMVIACSACSPKPDPALLDKLLILCRKAGVEAAICITKADVDKVEALHLYERYAGTGYPIFVMGTSEDYQQELSRIKNLISGKMVSFAGQSGVGKSTLVNRIIDRICMDTGEISEKIGRGKHTTRHSQIFIYEEGFLADTPGFSSLELEDLEVTGEDVLKGYPEIEKWEGKCKFTGCRHIGETGCAVKENEVDFDRLMRYRQFRKQMDAIQPYELKKKKSGGK